VTDSSSYSKEIGTDGDGEKQFAPSFERNIDPICAVLPNILSSGTVLELGSGTGQHIAQYRARFPGITWIASEPDPVSRASCEAWAGKGAPPTRNIDASSDWASDVADITPLSAILSSNVIHISPIQTLHGILNGAGKTLAPDGCLIFYGPFAESGEMSDGNRAFDASLKSRNPNWGVRDLDTVQTLADGFTLTKRFEMPANNLIIVLTRS